MFPPRTPVTRRVAMNMALVSGDTNLLSIFQTVLFPTVMVACITDADCGGVHNQGGAVNQGRARLASQDHPCRRVSSVGWEWRVGWWTSCAGRKRSLQEAANGWHLCTEYFLLPAHAVQCTHWVTVLLVGELRPPNPLALPRGAQSTQLPAAPPKPPALNSEQTSMSPKALKFSSAHLWEVPFFGFWGFART